MTRILIIAPAWVGDVVMAQSLVARLRQHHPDATIDVVVPAPLAPLAARMPGVTNALPVNFTHGRVGILGSLRFGHGLRESQYDWAIVLRSNWKSALIPVAAAIPRRRGYLGESRYFVLNEARPNVRGRAHRRTVDVYASLAEDSGTPITDAPAPVLNADPDNARAVAERLGLAGETRPVVALCPGAEFGPAKRWPPAHFAALADRLAEKDYALWLIGGPKEAEAADAMLALVRARDKRALPVNLCGKTSIIEALDLLSLTAAAVTNDSGLMHVAAALGRPVVALFGSTSSTVSPPLSERARVLEIDLPCRPCGKRICPLGHLDCLNLIKASDVAAAVLEVIAPAAPPPLAEAVGG